jgi:hypothetical protein
MKSKNREYLIKVLEQINYPSLNFILLESRGCRVTSCSLEGRWCELGSSDESAWTDRTRNCAGLLESLASSTACRFENSCSKHCSGFEGLVARREVQSGVCRRVGWKKLKLSFLVSVFLSNTSLL